MKALVSILILSLIANVAICIAHFGSAPPSGSFTHSTSATGPTAKTPEVTSGKKPSSPSDAGSAGIDPKTWSQFATDDLKTLASRLRAAGFPSSLVTAVIKAQVHERFAERRKALTPDIPVVPFWQKQPSAFDSSRSTALRQLSREETALTKEVLGTDGGDGQALTPNLQRQFGNLAPEKAQQTQTILNDYGELSAEIYSKANGVLLPEDRAKLALIEKEKQADLTALLTPQEYEDYQLRSSPTANTLRRQLALLNPTEQEFRSLFTLQKQIDDQFPTQYGTSADEFAKRRQAQQDMVVQAQAVLSPDRYADYKLLADPQNQMTATLLGRLDLPVSTLSKLTAVQQEVTQRATAVRMDNGASPEAKSEQLAALTQEAMTKLTGILGKDGADAYKTYGGYWLQMIQPRPVITRR